MPVPVTQLWRSRRKYVFNREVWRDLGNHPTEALAAQGARSPCSQIRGRWSRSCGVIGVTSTLFYSISFSSSSIANWLHIIPVLVRDAVLGSLYWLTADL